MLADGTVLLYLSPHRLLCASAKNLPVISKLRQEVPPVLSAVNKRLPHHKNDLKRMKVCSGGRLPSKDRESSSGTGGDGRAQGAQLPGRGSKYGVPSRLATAGPPLESPISAGKARSSAGQQPEPTGSPAQPRPAPHQPGGAVVLHTGRGPGVKGGSTQEVRVRGHTLCP